MGRRNTPQTDAKKRRRPKRKPGRPTSLTSVVRERILSAVGKGLPYVAACRCAGIDDSTFRRWRQRAEEGDRRFRAFFTDLTRVEAERAEAVAEAITKAVNDDWKAGAWWLERRFPDDFGKREKVEHSGPEGGPIPVSQMPDDKLNARIAELERKVGGATKG